MELELFQTGVIKFFSDVTNKAMDARKESGQVKYPF